MPNKSNVSSRASKKNGFRFRWWMAVILVVLVGGAGIAVLRFSKASNEQVYYASNWQTDLGEFNKSQASGLVTDTSGKFPVKVMAFSGVRSIQCNGWFLGLGDPYGTKPCVNWRPALYPGSYKACFYGKNIQGSGTMNLAYVLKDYISGPQVYYRSGGIFILPKTKDYVTPVCAYFDVPAKIPQGGWDELFERHMCIYGEEGSLNYIQSMVITKL